jgi:hypothetical protein
MKGGIFNARKENCQESTGQKASRQEASQEGRAEKGCRQEASQEKISG